MSDPTPVPPHLSDAERALWEKASATSAMTGWWFPSNALERDGFLPENAEFVAACTPAVIRALLTALSVERAERSDDTKRLSWMQERAAYATPVFDMDPEAEIGYTVTSDDLDFGEGATLRDAIDAARQTFRDVSLAAPSTETPR